MPRLIHTIDHIACTKQRSVLMLVLRPCAQIAAGRGFRQTASLLHGSSGGSPAGELGNPTHPPVRSSG